MVEVDLVKNSGTSSLVNLENVRRGIIEYVEDKLPNQDILVELVISSPAAVHELNLRHRRKDKTTDVLSFPIFNNETEIKENPGLTNIGTIVINLDQSVKQALDNQRTPEEETLFLCQHSIEHLLGHHHPE